MVGAVERIRVLFAEGAATAVRGLRDALDRQRDMVVVKTIAGRGLGLLVAVREERPDVVVVELERGQLPGECTHVLGEDPHIAVLALGAGEQCKIYRFDLQGRDVSDLSLDGLIDAIRATLRIGN